MYMHIRHCLYGLLWYLGWHVGADGSQARTLTSRGTLQNLALLLTSCPHCPYYPYSHPNHHSCCLLQTIMGESLPMQIEELVYIGIFKKSNAVWPQTMPCGINSCTFAHRSRTLKHSFRKKNCRCWQFDKCKLVLGTDVSRVQSIYPPSTSQQRLMVTWLHYMAS